MKKNNLCNKGRASGGQIVGIKKNISDGWTVEDWKFGLILKSKSSTYIITVYNSVRFNHVEQSLRSVIEQGMSECETVLVCGDINARVGGARVWVDLCEEDQILRSSQDQTINEDGKKLIRLCEELGLTLLNGRTKGDEQGCITYIGRNECYNGSVIDLFLIADRSNLKVIESLKVMSRLESDHFPVVLTIKSSWNGTDIVEYNSLDAEYAIEKIKWQQDKANGFCEIMTKKLKEGVFASAETEARWKNIVDVIWEATRGCGMAKELNKRVEEVNKAKGVSKWWAAINKFRVSRKQAVSFGISEVQWVEYFKSLLGHQGGAVTLENRTEEPWLHEAVNVESQTQDDDTLGGLFTAEEVKDALGRMSNGKAVGEDSIPVECVKIVRFDAEEILCGVMNEIWMNCRSPKGWCKARIVPIYKSGDEKVVSNYRGISLLDVGYKLITNMMAEKLMVWAEKEEILKESQAGFRRRRDTRDHIFVLNALKRQ
ncbi:uncharacterized protein [Chelonus insularis]|uniref:uncharacterized protein n=1 Tax=Chelonus insularis TaxID=460826 RepID=UPI00158A5BD4|nr:uncharacterized protein LOC118067535 [Chelonus insularis]